MKLFSFNQFNPQPSQDILSSKVYGIVVQMYLSNFLTGDNNKFSELALQGLKLNIKNIAINYKKKVALSVIFGDYSGNIYDDEPKIPFVEMVRKAHQGKGQPVKVKLPIPWHGAYIEKIKLFLDWFSRELYKDIVVWEAIDNLKICGINEVSAECRVTAQDWEDTENPNIAYDVAALKWRLAGYTCQNTRDAFAAILKAWMDTFPHKQLILPVIGSLNGFPCITEKNRICKPRERPNLTEQFIEHGKNYPNFGVQYTALSTIGQPPDFITESNVPIIYQANNQVFHTNDVTQASFEAMIQNGIDNKGEGIEIWDNCVRMFPDVIKKYAQ